MDVRDQLETALRGTYTLERELGGGGMSRVFIARDSSLGRLVVAKILTPDLVSGLILERFRREVTLAARLQHPNIVPLLSAGEADGLPYYTMPFVDGESLCARIERAGELPLREAVAILRDVARALAYAHGQDIVHRTSSRTTSSFPATTRWSQTSVSRRRCRSHAPMRPPTR